MKTISDSGPPKIGDMVKWYTFYDDSIVKDAGYGIVIKHWKSKKVAPIDAPNLYDTYYVFKFSNNHNSASWFYLEDIEPMSAINKNNNNNNSNSNNNNTNNNKNNNTNNNKNNNKEKNNGKLY